VSRIQDRPDEREIALDRVGVAGLRYPLRVPLRGGGDVRADAVVGLWVSLRADDRATHMSRFVSALESRCDAVLTPNALEELLRSLRESLDVDAAFLEIEHPHYIVKRAPESEASSRLACDVSLAASLEGERFDLVQSVRVPVLSVCPCSMEATGGASHSQRGHVTVAVRAQGRVWVEDLVEVIEASASAPLYPLLRSGDDRTIVRAAHDRPVLVEDLARNVAERLDSDVRILWYRVDARNLDSVHAHDACASVTRSPRDLQREDTRDDRGADER
jgi:GTP cyclohydrolase I